MSPAYLVGDPLEFGKELGDAAADYFIANNISAQNRGH